MTAFSHAMPANYAKPSVFSRVLNQAGTLLLIALLPALLAGMFHSRKPAWSRERMSLPGVTAEQIARGEGRTLFVDARKRLITGNNTFPEQYGSTKSTGRNNC